MNLFAKINGVRMLIHATLQEKLDDKNIRIAVDHITRHKYNVRKSPLTENEIIISDILARNKLKACTVFTWFYSLSFDDDIKKELSYQQTSLRSAASEMQKRKKETKEGLEKEILDDINAYVGALRTADKNKILRGIQNGY